MPCKIGFLLNHDAAHQAAHSVPVAIELAARSDCSITIIVTSQAEAGAVADICAARPQVTVAVQQWRVPTLVRWLDRLTGSALALKRVGTLWYYRNRLAGMTALVVPEKTSVLLKSWLGDDCPVLINIRHGAGDRACGNFGRKMALFDLHLLPGPKYERLLQATGLVDADHYAVIGYPKLEHYAPQPRPKYFSNDRPVVVYAPHFDPLSSSWYDWGRQVLEYFVSNPQYNLIFAPHVLLFARDWHVSSAGGRPRKTGSIPAAARAAENIHIDSHSQALVDMSYMRAADIYLGDVSSQIYEFLYLPRPCIFLDPRQTDWQHNAQYRFWHCGVVVQHFAQFESALQQAQSEHARYLPEQQQAFADTFSVCAEPAAARAADAIMDFLRRTHPR